MVFLEKGDYSTAPLEGKSGLGNGSLEGKVTRYELTPESPNLDGLRTSVSI